MTRSTAVVLGIALAVLPVAGCSGMRQPDPCEELQDLVAAAESLRALDPATTTAEELTSAVEDVRVELDQFQAASEARFDTAISNLRAEVSGLRQSVGAGDPESLDAARASIEQSMDAIGQAWTALLDSTGTLCLE